MTVLAALILIVALAGVLVRPRDVHESTWAALGALAMLVTGVEPLDGAWHVFRGAGLARIADAPVRRRLRGLVRRLGAAIAGGSIVRA